MSEWIDDPFENVRWPESRPSEELKAPTLLKRTCEILVCKDESLHKEHVPIFNKYRCGKPAIRRRPEDGIDSRGYPRGCWVCQDHR
jgi:hypothetical protein